MAAVLGVDRNSIIYFNTGRMAVMAISIKVFLVCLFMSSSLSMAEQLKSIRDLQWKYRIFILSAPCKESDFAQQAKKELKAHGKEIAERDGYILEIYHNSVADDSLEDDTRTKLKLDPSKPSLTLIGKDGGIKMKQTEKPNIQSLLDLIDTMPMRRAEMRERK